jgi:hypothetical protein
VGQGRRPRDEGHLRALGLIAVALAAAACTRNPYIVGAICTTGCGGADGGAGQGDAGVNPKATLSVGLDQSGVSYLPSNLELPSGSIAPALRLRGEQATQAGWPAEVGGSFGVGPGAALLPFEAPFTDETGAVAFDPSFASYIASDTATADVGSDDFVVEVVLRAAANSVLLLKAGTDAGWRLALDGAGVLGLSVADGTPSHAALVTSEPLVENAWYHCVFWVSRVAGGRADCDGRPGSPVPLASLGSLDVHLVPWLGGGGPARLALLALYRVPAGGLGDAATWLDVSRRRFATLTGARPRVAKGTALPMPGLRATPAYLDLQRTAAGARELFLVGPDWPRIACRFGTSGGRVCGFLSEPQRTRLLPRAPLAWTPSELTVGPGRAVFLDGEPSLVELVPSKVVGAHALSATATAGPAHQVFSFYAAPALVGVVAAEAGGKGRAVFDLVAGTVVSAPAGVRATIEPWGRNVFRCSYAFDAGPGASTYAIDVIQADGASFAGDGAAAWVRVAAPQLDVGVAFAGSPYAADMEVSDQLTFVGDDGNLPTTVGGQVSLRLLLPAGPRLTDQALLNLNLGGAFTDQIQLYVRGDTGKLKFWGLRGGDTHWAVEPAGVVVDGAAHAVVAEWDAASARISLDGVGRMQPALIPNAAVTLDRIYVGFSSKSSGALEGLVSGFEIAAR